MPFLDLVGVLSDVCCDGGVADGTGCFAQIVTLSGHIDFLQVSAQAGDNTDRERVDELVRKEASGDRSHCIEIRKELNLSLQAQADQARLNALALSHSWLQGDINESFEKLRIRLLHPTQEIAREEPAPRPHLHPGET